MKILGFLALALLSFPILSLGESRTMGPAFDELARSTVLKPSSVVHCSGPEECALQRARQLGEFHAVADGPNCFNLVLLYTGILPAARNTNDEIDFYLNSPLCRARKAGEERQPGDIGAIQRFIHFGDHKYSWRSEHAFIHLSRDKVYEKVGWDKKYPYRIADRKESYKDYWIDPTTDELAPAPEYVWYKRRVRYYKCTPLSNYLQTIPVSNEIRRLRQLLNQISDLEAKLEKRLLFGAPLPAEFMADLSKLRSSATSIGGSKLTSNEKFVGQIFQSRVEAIDYQLKTYPIKD